MSTSETTNRALKSTSGRRKDALIAAIATVLAAVILAAGGIIAAGKRDRAELREDISTLQASLSDKTKQVSVLEQKLRLAEASVRDVAAAAAPSTSNPDTTTMPTVARALIARQQEQGFDIAFYGCSRATGTVKCQFDVTNTKAERYFRVQVDSQENSRGYDDHGQQLLATSAEIPGADNAGLTIPDGVTVSASITFTTVPSSTTKFVVLKFVFTYDYNRYSVEFRNVDFTG